MLSALIRVNITDNIDRYGTLTSPPSVCQDSTQVCSRLRCVTLTLTCGHDRVWAYDVIVVRSEKKDVPLMCTLRYVLLLLGIKDKQGKKRKVFCGR